MRNTRFAALSLVVALICSAAALAAQMTAPDRAIAATVEAALDAAQSGDLAALRGQYLPDCTFVDEFAPFYWSGPGAIDAYFASAAQMYKDTQMAGTKVWHGAPKYTYADAGTAYVTVPLRVHATAHGKPYRATGTLTFTLKKTSAGWKIASQSWAKETENINPY